jgi:hypothetical protein
MVQAVDKGHEGMWKVRASTGQQARVIYDSGQELARYRLDLVGIQEISWDKGSTGGAKDYTSYD